MALLTTAAAVNIRCLCESEFMGHGGMTCDSNFLVQVFDIGPNCDEPARKVAELPDYLQQVTNLAGPRQAFAPNDDKRSTAIKYLAVVRK